MCSGLRRGRSYLLCPLLTPVFSSRRLSTTLAQGKTTGLPGYCALTFPLMPAASTPELSVQVLDFEDICLLIQLCRLLCGFCSSGQRFACGFLRIPPHGGHPCRPANDSPCRVRRGLSPPNERALPGAQQKAADFSAGGFLNQNRPEIIASRSCHIHGNPENNPCEILLDNHGCRCDNGWSYWGRDACSCERLSALCPIRRDSLYIPPCVHDDRPSGRRPNDPVSGHPSGHPGGHGPNPALERWTDSIDQERSQSLLQEPTRMRTS
jgi:hypothetical protein